MGHILEEEGCITQLRSEALGLIPSGYPCTFSSVCFYPDLPPVAYHQFLLPVVVNHKNYHVYYAECMLTIMPSPSLVC